MRTNIFETLQRLCAGRGIVCEQRGKKIDMTTPDGKFYACLTRMEHIWLAKQFGKTEKEAEEAGWIKINLGLMNDINILHFKKPTQKQLDTLFDWCQKHKAELPDWATEV